MSSTLPCSRPRNLPQPCSKRRHWHCRSTHSCSAGPSSSVHQSGRELCCSTHSPQDDTITSACCQHPAAAPVRNHPHQLRDLAATAMLFQAALAQQAHAASETLTSAAPVLADGAKYVPSPYEPGWEVWVGFVAGVIPFAIGSYEFGKRIIIQQRCELCAGKGLVPSTNANAQYLRKCPQCGGFFPWISWKMFLTSTAAPGNGGPLQQPKGQTSVFYKVPEAMPTPEQKAAARAQYLGQSNSAVPHQVGQQTRNQQTAQDERQPVPEDIAEGRR